MTGWRIPLARPEIDDSDRQAVSRVLDSPILSIGPEAESLEQEFEQYLGVPSALVSNGTAGLFVALRLLGLEGGKVLTPSLGFIGTAHAIRMAGAEPRFVDVCPESLVCTVQTLEAAYDPECRAVVPVDLFGTPLDSPAIREWAESRDLILVQDTCEALGARWNGEPVGSHAPASVFAFYPNKQMTTGEGGLVSSPDPDLIARVRSFRNQGRGEGHFEFVGDGFNFRLCELQAALGRSQLRRLGDFLAARSRVAGWYDSLFEDVPGLATLPPAPAPGERSWFVYPVFVQDPAWRDPVRQTLAASGIQTAAYFPPLHSFKPYANPALLSGPLPFTEAISQRSFAIPFFNQLPESACAEVAATLRSALPKSDADPQFSLQTLASTAP